MINFIKHHDIDKKRWDHSILNSANFNIYGMSFYLDIVSPGWDALIEGDYESIFPLTWRRKFGINYLYQPFFTQQNGVYFKEKPNQNLLQSFLNMVEKHYKYIDICLNTENNFPVEKYKLQPKVTHHLNLHQPYQKLEKQYSTNHLRNLKKARTGAYLILNDPERITDIIKLFRVTKGKSISTLKNSDYKMFLVLCDEMKKRGFCEVLYTGDGQSKVIGGIIVFKIQNNAVFIFSALAEQYKNTGLMHLLIDRYIEKHAGENLILDFEGSMNPQLARFYKGFGSEVFFYPHITLNNLPSAVRWLKK